MAMNDKTSDVVNNVCTILGAALLLHPIIDQATKTLAPEMQKLTSGEAVQDLKLLPIEQERHDDSEQRDKEKHKTYDDEISELKRKLAEYESRSDEPTNEALTM